MKTRDIQRSARNALRLLARHERHKKSVLAIYGLDASTVCVCENEIDAEVITIALNEARDRHATRENPMPGWLERTQ